MRKIDAQNSVSSFTYNIKVNRLSWSLEIQNAIARNVLYLLCTAGEVWSGEIQHCDLETADAMPAPHNSRHRNISLNTKIFVTYLSVYSIKDSIPVVICLKTSQSGYDPKFATGKNISTYKANTKHFRLLLCSSILKRNVNYYYQMYDKHVLLAVCISQAFNE
jgi:hypothetical protein